MKYLYWSINRVSVNNWESLWENFFFSRADFEC